MKTPAIQNDFSYYRRSVSRRSLSEEPPADDSPRISGELANRMSLFYAQATPMLKVLSEATSQFVNDNQQDLENTTETLSTMAKVCLRMLENPPVPSVDRSPQRLYSISAPLDIRYLCIGYGLVDVNLTRMEPGRARRSCYRTCVTYR
ncbi:Protein FAM49B [Eumeta japonica]|uniref:Protein FAM49B n=1 Tax=Eumeta variegata TaxID=151549 RepID=A0A4C1YTG4_EUMVA|nr:Protein FAM49B [Eumeta japonica]